MDFVTMQSQLSDILGVYDNTVATDLTKIKRWLNMAQQYICGKMNWPFMYAEETVQTVTDYTTGTVATVAGSTSVTFSGTISTSKANFFLQTASTSDWYQITSHTAGSASATITPAAIATNGTAAFTIRKLHYSTTTPLRSILDMKQLTTPVRVISRSPRESDYFLPLFFSTGDSYQYILSTPTSTGNFQFSLLYSPSSVFNVMVRGIKSLTDMSADSDESVVPARWHDTLLNFAAWYGFQTVDDNRASQSFLAGEAGIGDMARVFNQDLGRHRVMQAVDQNSYTGPAWTLPSNYGPQVSG